MNEIFISYRRNDSADVTGRIRHDLADCFGADQVFNDVYSVRKGQNFRDAVFEAIDSSKVYLVVIGPKWFETSQETDRARLEDEDDNVRVELEAALGKHGLAIVPLLVGGASMPRRDDLPESLKDLSYLNGMSIRAGRDYDRDIKELEAVIIQLGVRKRAAPTQKFTSVPRVAAALVLVATVALAFQLPQLFSGAEDTVLPDSIGPAQDELPDSLIEGTDVAETVASSARIQNVQSLLNKLQFVAGTPDGKLGPATQRSIRAFQRSYGVAVSGEPSTLLLTQLNQANSTGFSNVTCETRQTTNQDCRDVTKTRSVPHIENIEHDLDGEIPCTFNINWFCNVYGCDWSRIENICEDNNDGRARLLYQCRSEYAGSLDDYDIDCNCGQSYCGCDTSATCSVQKETTKLEEYSERKCEPFTVTQEVCTCRSPEVCPDGVE